MIEGFAEGVSQRSKEMYGDQGLIRQGDSMAIGIAG